NGYSCCAAVSRREAAAFFLVLRQSAGLEGDPRPPLLTWCYQALSRQEGDRGPNPSYIAQLGGWEGYAVREDIHAGIEAEAPVASVSSDIGLSLTVTLLWTAHMLNSRRVRAAFVRACVRRPRPLRRCCPISESGAGARRHSPG